MRLLADTLSSRVGRKVIDDIGLAGEWGWDLEWSPAPSRGARCFQQFGPQLLFDEPIGVADIHRGKRY